MVKRNCRHFRLLMMYPQSLSLQVQFVGTSDFFCLWPYILAANRSRFQVFLSPVKYRQIYFILSSIFLLFLAISFVVFCHSLPFSLSVLFLQKLSETVPCSNLTEFRTRKITFQSAGLIAHQTEGSVCHLFRSAKDRLKKLQEKAGGNGDIKKGPPVPAKKVRTAATKAGKQNHGFIWALSRLAHSYFVHVCLVGVLLPRFEFSCSI